MKENIQKLYKQLKDKQGLETKIYICKNNACQLPVETVEEALQLITKSH